MKSLTEWYYPGGYLYAVGNLPYPENDIWHQTHEGWEILFVSNPNAEDEVVKFRFYLPNKAPVDTTFLVPAQGEIVFPIFERKYSHLTGGYNTPFGFRMQSEQPILPHITRAEYEPWTDITPGAMFGVYPYQGPLGNETCWYFADGMIRDSLDHPLVFQDWIQIINPNEEEVLITVTYYVSGEKISLERRLAGERVLLIKSEEVQGLPKEQPYAVKVEADRRIIAQQTRRGLEKGSHPASKSVMATLGIPLHI
jgi:hypothetical protein